MKFSGRYKSRAYGRDCSKKSSWNGNVEDRVNGSFCEPPEPYEVFSCSDGLAARVIANRRGLVAFCLGARRKWNLVSDMYALQDFLAVPSGLAERLAMGALVDPEELDVKARKTVMRLYTRGVMTVHEGRKTRYQLTDAETISDFKRQLEYISRGR